MLNDIQMQLRRFGIEDMDFYYRQTGQNPEEMRESLREDAVKQAERNLVISEILRTESLTVSDEEFEERIEQMIQGDEGEETTQLAEFLRSESGRTVLESQLLRDKAIERILAIARGQADALDEAQATGGNDDEDPVNTDSGKEETVSNESVISDDNGESVKEEE